MISHSLLRRFQRRASLPVRQLLVAVVACGLSALAAGPVHAQKVVSPPSMDTQRGSHFGTAITPVPDVNGDDTPDLLIGAPRQTVHTTDRDGDGALFVVDGTEGSVLTGVSSTSSDAVVGGQFGRSIAWTDGLKINTVAGAPGESVGEATEAGRVHLLGIYKSDPVTVHRVGSVSSPNPEKQGQFGWDVAGLPNENTIDAVVGAPGETVNDTASAGRLYGIRRDTSLWTLSSPNPAPEGHFGHAVAVVGDLNKDDAPDLVVGAPGEAPPSDRYPSDRVAPSGRAYFVSGADGSIIATLAAPAAATWGRFGSAVASGPDLSGDDTPDVLIGAPTAGVDGERGVGQAFLYSGPEASPVATLSPKEREKGNEFGDGLTILKGAQGSNSPHFAVGAPGAGRVHLFSSDGSHTSVLDAPDATGRGTGQFGSPLATTDVSGDGEPDLIVGAKTGSPTDNFDTTTPEAGQVFIYENGPGGFAPPSSSSSSTGSDDRSSVTSSDRSFEAPEAPEGFSTQVANWSNVRISLVYPNEWTAVDLEKKAGLSILDLSRKKGTAKKRWAGWMSGTSGERPEPLRLFGAENASVFVVGSGLMGSVKDNPTPKDFIDASNENARVRNSTITQPLRDTTIAGFDAAVFRVKGTSRDGYDVTYEITVLRTAESVLGVKVLRPTGETILTDEMLQIMFDHFRISPPESE